VRVGAFETDGPLPELREPHALAMLRPWIDVGSVGNMLISRLESRFNATKVARLAKPGNFFDFTRYRPTLYVKEDRRQVKVPNAYATCASREAPENDLVFLHLLEPHMLGETYVESVLLLLQKLGIRRYCLLGSMYDAVPHTRPPIVTGMASTAEAQEHLARVGVQRSDYQGPTTFVYLISQRAPEMGIETITLIVHLPQYTQLDEDYTGMLRLMEVICSLYGLSTEHADIQKAEQQRKRIDVLVEKDPQVKRLVSQMEARYDDRIQKLAQGEMPQLSPEVERFLDEMEKRLGHD
jgi:hypothetical protein